MALLGMEELNFKQWFVLMAVYAVLIEVVAYGALTVAKKALSVVRDWLDIQARGEE